MLVQILIAIAIALMIPFMIDFIRIIGAFFVMAKYKTKSVDELFDIMIDNAYRYQQRVWNEYLSKESLSKGVAQRLKDQIEMHSRNIYAATEEAKKTMELTDEQKSQIEEINKNFKTFLSKLEYVLEN